MRNTAPDFSLFDQHGNLFNLYETLDKYSGVLLIFYPKDDSPICTKQLCDYNFNIDEFKKYNIFVAGINVEDKSSHILFSNKYGLKYPLLCDTDKQISKYYNALNLFGINKRKLVLINSDKIILYNKSVLSLFYENTGDVIKIIESIDQFKMT